MLLYVVNLFHQEKIYRFGYLRRANVLYLHLMIVLHYAQHWGIVTTVVWCYKQWMEVDYTRILIHIQGHT